MKILFVRPPVPKHTIGLKHIMICEPLELEYIAAGIKDHDLMIFDFLVETNFDRRLQNFNPDIVISSCYKSGTNEVIKLMRHVKEYNIKIITIAGGVHATLNPKDFCDESIDIIGMGDGTILVPEIITAIQLNKNLLTVPGIAIPIGMNTLKYSPKRVYMPPADTLPFPRRDLVKHLQHKYYYLMHKPVATMKTTWGCWYKCNFCFTWKITDGMPYSRSPESIIAEILTIPAKEIYIVDDIFLINKSRLRKIADLLVKHKIKKHFLCFARADFIADNEEIIAEWASLGLRAVFIGLDAITDAELKKMNKQSPAYQNKKAIEILRKHKIDTYGSLIPGADYLPEDWQRLWQFIEDAKLYYVNVSPATPLPGAPDFKLQADNLTVPIDAHGLFDLSHQLMPTKMPIKAYYRELLKLYWKTVMNLSRADKNTFRTLPTIWHKDYWNIILGGLKIGWQFYHAHTHHTAKEIAIATYKGPKVKHLTFLSKALHPSFRNLFNLQNENNILAPISANDSQVI